MTRQEAIELLVNATYSEEWQGNEQLAKAQHMAIQALEQVPKCGKWIHEELIPNSITGHMHAECTNCHEVRIIDNFCPNCGAKMKG